MKTVLLGILLALVGSSPFEVRYVEGKMQLRSYKQKVAYVDVKKFRAGLYRPDFHPDDLAHGPDVDLAELYQWLCDNGLLSEQTIMGNVQSCDAEGLLRRAARDDRDSAQDGGS